jgi:hypothetical protein
MAFNEKLNKLLEETQKKKPFNYDIIFTKNSEFKKQNTCLWKVQGTVNGAKKCNSQCLIMHFE